MHPKNCTTCKHSNYIVGNYVHCGTNKINMPYWWSTMTGSQEDLVNNLGCGSYEKQE